MVSVQVVIGIGDGRNMNIGTIDRLADRKMDDISLYMSFSIYIRAFAFCLYLFVCAAKCPRGFTYKHKHGHHSVAVASRCAQAICNSLLAQFPERVKSTTAKQKCQVSLRVCSVTAAQIVCL